MDVKVCEKNKVLVNGKCMSKTNKKLFTAHLKRPGDANFAYILRVIANEIEDGKTKNKEWEVKKI